MKWIIVMLLAIIVVPMLLVSCSREATRYESPGVLFGVNYTVYVIDGCEYIRYGSALTHKGNCTNSIHIYRMENNETHR